MAGRVDHRYAVGDFARGAVDGLPVEVELEVFDLVEACHGD